jgi:hypothetical protein
MLSHFIGQQPVDGPNGQTALPDGVAAGSQRDLSRLMGTREFFS